MQTGKETSAQNQAIMPLAPLAQILNEFKRLALSELYQSKNAQNLEDLRWTRRSRNVLHKEGEYSSLGEFLIECEAIIKDHQGISNPQLGHKDGGAWECCQIKKTQMYKRFLKKKLVKRNKRAFLFKLYAYVDHVEEKRFLNLFKLTHIQRKKKKTDDHFIGILK